MSGSSGNIEELLATSFNRKCGSPNRMSESIEAQVGSFKGVITFISLTVYVVLLLLYWIN